MKYKYIALHCEHSFDFLLIVYINHRPAFGLDPGKLLTAFETLGIQTSQGNAIERGDLLDMLQTKG